MPRSTKRANGEGSVVTKTVRKCGKKYTYYYAVLTVGYDSQTGRQLQQTVSPGCRTKSEAQWFLQRALTERDAGYLVRKSKETVADRMAVWLAEHTKGIKPSTPEDYDCFVRNYINPYLGAVKLQELTPELVQSFVNEMRGQGGRELMPKTVRNVHAALHKALERAVWAKKIPANPASGTSLPRLQKRRDTREIVSPANARDFIEAAQGNFYAPIARIDLSKKDAARVFLLRDRVE